jgi:diketogulonate reductase-like aldo/keto reductase
MELRLFGSTKRFVARIGQGTWFIEDADRDIAIAALRRGLDLGMTISTPRNSTEAARRKNWWARRSPGGATRFSSSRKCFPKTPPSLEPAWRASGHSPVSIPTAWTATCCIGVAGTPFEETIAGFEDLQRAGKILSWGVSDVPDLRDALAIAGQGEGRLACNQVLYHLQERAIEHAVLPWCERHGVAVTAYSPFGHGNFPGSGTEGGRVLAKIAAAYEATPRQVALAFLTRRPSLFAIPKASTPAHAEENAGAGDLQLSDSDVALIDAVFPRGPQPRALPVL